MRDRLALLAVATFLPPARSIREMALAAGADVSGYEGWDFATVAREDEHPSDMGAAALKRALAAADIPASRLSLVLAVGVSRDYLPSWSVATEVMRLCGAPAGCLGLDLSIGCLGVVSGLEVARGWLRNNGGCAAIIAAERWSHTVDRGAADAQALWGHADGAGALIVSADLLEDRPPLGWYTGASFHGRSDLNGLLLVKYGGTRFPIAPPDETPFRRQIRPIAKRELFAAYRAAYQVAFDATRARFGRPAELLACNQTSPKLVQMLADLAGLAGDDERVCRSGREFGHVGSADVVIALERFASGGHLGGSVYLAGSTPYAFGVGLIEPAAQ